MDCHHLRVHAEAHVCLVAAAAADALKGGEAGRCRYTLAGFHGEGRGRELACFEGAAVIAGAMVVEALAHDFAALDNDAAVAVEERRLGRLLEAEIQVVVVLHLDDARWEFRLAELGSGTCRCFEAAFVVTDGDGKLELCLGASGHPHAAKSHTPVSRSDARTTLILAPQLA